MHKDSYDLLIITTQEKENRWPDKHPTQTYIQMTHIPVPALQLVDIPREHQP